MADLSQLSKEQLVQTIQGLTAVAHGVEDASEIDVSRFEDASPEALQLVIDKQLGPQVAPPQGVNSNVRGLRGSRLPQEGDANLNFGEEEDLSTGSAPVQQKVKDTLTKGLAGDPAADMMQFHAIMAFYGGHNVNFDGVISDAERQTATDLLDQLNQGVNPDQTRTYFTEEAQRAEAEAAAAEQAAQQAALEQKLANIDATLAARGYMDLDHMYSLTDTSEIETYRAAAVNNFLSKDGNHESISAEHGINFIDAQQRILVEPGRDISIQDPDFALDIVRTKLNDRHMGERVEKMLESGDSNQIKQAQSILGVDATGVVDAETFRLGKDYIREGYESTFENNEFLKGFNGQMDMEIIASAANNGELYIPTGADGNIDFDALRAAGMSDIAIQAIQFNPTYAEAMDQGLNYATTQQEAIAIEYMNNPALYQAVIDARNEMASSRTLDVEVQANTQVQANTPEATAEGSNPEVETIVAPYDLKRIIEGDLVQLVEYVETQGIDLPEGAQERLEGLISDVSQTGPNMPVDTAQRALDLAADVYEPLSAEQRGEITRLDFETDPIERFSDIRDGIAHVSENYEGIDPVNTHRADQLLNPERSEPTSAQNADEMTTSTPYEQVYALLPSEAIDGMSRQMQGLVRSKAHMEHQQQQIANLESIENQTPGDELKLTSLKAEHAAMQERFNTRVDRLGGPEAVKTQLEELQQDPGADQTAPARDEMLISGTNHGPDTLTGSSGTDTLAGGQGPDTLRGNFHDAALTPGDDTMPSFQIPATGRTPGGILNNNGMSRGFAMAGSGEGVPAAGKVLPTIDHRHDAQNTLG